MPMYVAIAGLALAATSAISQGQAASNNASYQAAIASNNAKIAGQNADYAVAAGSEKATETSLRGAARTAAVRAGIAANGIDVNSGSAKDVQASERRASTLDTETVTNNALLQAYGYKVAGVNNEAQSGLLSAEAGQATAGSALRAGGTLLSGASSIGTKWLSSTPGATGDTTSPDDFGTMTSNFGT